MQLQVFIPLCAVFLCVVDSHRPEFQRHRFPPGYKLVGDVLMKRQTGNPDVTTEDWNQPTTESLPPMPTGEYPGEYPGETESPEMENEDEWPYAMMECPSYPYTLYSGKSRMTSLFGRCLTTVHMSKRMRMKKPQDGFLTQMCPHVFKLAKRYADASETMKETLEEYVEESFALVQCANLLAVKDNMLSLIKMAKPSEPELPESEPPQPLPPQFRNGIFRRLKFNTLKSRASKPEWEGEVKPENEGPMMEDIKSMVKALFEEAKELFDVCENTFGDAFQSFDQWEMEMEQELGPP